MTEEANHLSDGHEVPNGITPFTAALAVGGVFLGVALLGRLLKTPPHLEEYQRLRKLDRAVRAAGYERGNSIRPAGYEVGNG